MKKFAAKFPAPGNFAKTDSRTYPLDSLTV
jgi:hypothetical protein